MSEIPLAFILFILVSAIFIFRLSYNLVAHGGAYSTFAKNWWKWLIAYAVIIAVYVFLTG